MPSRRADQGLDAGSRLIAESLRSQFARLRELSSAVAADPQVERIHAARVTSRRLRSLLKTFRPLLDARRVRLCRMDLRSFARALGGVREADVRAQLLLELATDVAKPGSRELARLATRLEESQRTARKALESKVAEPEWAALVGAIGVHARDPLLATVMPADLARVLQLARRPWRKALQRARSNPSAAAELHELRLALKHCRYAVEPFTLLEPDATGRLLRRLRKAQDGLGECRDAEFAGEWLRERSRARGLAAALARRLEDQESALRAEARAQVGKLEAAYDKWWRAVREVRRAG